MIKSRKYFTVLFFLLIGTQLLEAKENVGMKKAAAPVQSKLMAGCPATTAQTDLSINNVRARILNGGDLWWDYNENSTGIYEVPSGSGKIAIYAGALWIAGYDAANNLKAACQTYRQQGANDFWAGPISKKPDGSIDVSADVCSAYDRFWILNKSDVEDFAAGKSSGGASSEAISSWPGNGNLANGELPFLAPFFDSDNNGKYEPAAGDYPNYLITGDYVKDECSGKSICNDFLFGDRTIWWVFNDVGNIHTETNSLFNIGLEIRAQAFSFSTTDEVNNMTFYKYQIINRNPETLVNTYFGQWCDADLGDASDDLVGCDVNLGLGFCYNGDADDGGATGYGVNPPAIGIDFFQGPYADFNDGIDNDRDGCIDGFDTINATTGLRGCCPESTTNKEQIVMSKFLYYTNTNGVPTGNPGPTDDYYQFLDGRWTDGVQVTYGGDGRGAGPGATATPCNFMFPGTTDPDNPTDWTMTTGGIQPDDMRFLESAGTFSLAPGAVNYVTTGVVWAQSIGGGPAGSITLMKIADAKAQSLFNACFKVLSGPDAPNITIRELDKELILTLTNTGNSKVEGYNEIDVTIPPKVPSDTNPNVLVSLTDKEKRYKFEGYKIYQVVDATVKASDLEDITKAKQIAQIDVNNDIGVIINYEYDSYIKKWIPVQKTDGLPNNININKGLVHSFKITTDLFSTRPLVNFKAYYFLAVSYAYNNFRPFNDKDPLLTQSKPYFLGGKNTKAYSGIPHKPVVNNMGMVLNSTYQQNTGAGIKRIEGQGNGGHVLDFASGVDDEILNSPDNRSANPVYLAGNGPIKFTVADPVKIKGGSFTLKFDGVDSVSNYSITDKKNNVVIDQTVAGIYIRGDHSLDSLGFLVNASLSNIADTNRLLTEGLDPSYNNGFLEASMSFSGDNWLTGVKDNDAVKTKNWILAGTALASSSVEASDLKGDPKETFEKALGGTWAPFALTSGVPTWSVKPNGVQGGFLSPLVSANSIKYDYMNSVDIVITSDKAKWTRCIVFETGTINRFKVKAIPSVDKDGNPDGSGTTGLGWFPGYALNLETGERLNMAFGENSRDTVNKGTNMRWDPTSIDTGTVYGGRHYVYIFNHIIDTSFSDPSNDLYMPAYDNADSLYRYTVGTNNSTNKLRNFLRSCIWAGMPLVAPGKNYMASDVRIRLRVNKTYKRFVPVNTTAIDSGNPRYEFSIPTNLSPAINQTEKAKSALDLISVVPNPYYGYSSYERTIRDQLDNRVRFVNLPSKCTVRIYNLSGTLVRTLIRDVAENISDGYAVEANTEDKNLSSTLDWDLSNSAGIKVSSGVYIVHIDAGELGEKVIKWFGILRPIDLDSF